MNVKTSECALQPILLFLLDLHKLNFLNSLLDVFLNLLLLHSLFHSLFNTFLSSQAFPPSRSHFVSLLQVTSQVSMKSPLVSSNAAAQGQHQGPAQYQGPAQQAMANEPPRVFVPNFYWPENNDGILRLVLPPP